MISAVINTYNEEKNLTRCLKSLTWADEIVVVDMGSSDKTVSIAKSFKASTYTYPYKGFVEPARNFAIEKAKGDWVLIVDADEEIPTSLTRIFKEIEKRGSIDYLRIPRSNIIFGKHLRHSGWWPDFQIRFFKKGAVTWNEKIHGIPFTKGVGEDLEISTTNCIVHHNYETVSEFLKRLDRYTTIMSKDLIGTGYTFDTSDLFEKPLKEFLSRFFALSGYKDGLHGFVLSILQAFSEFVVYLKVWEESKFKEKKISFDELDNHLDHATHDIRYWMLEKQVSDSKSLSQKLFLKLKNKLT